GRSRAKGRTNKKMSGCGTEAVRGNACLHFAPAGSGAGRCFVPSEVRRPALRPERRREETGVARRGRSGRDADPPVGLRLDTARDFKSRFVQPLQRELNAGRRLWRKVGHDVGALGRFVADWARGCRTRPPRSFSAKLFIGTETPQMK